MNKKVTYEVKLRKHTAISNVADEEIAKAIQMKADQYYWQAATSCEAKIVSVEPFGETCKKVVYDVILKKKSFVNAETEEEVAKAVQKDADMHYWNSVDDCETSVLEIEDMG